MHLYSDNYPTAARKALGLDIDHTQYGGGGVTVMAETHIGSCSLEVTGLSCHVTVLDSHWPAML